MAAFGKGGLREANFGSLTAKGLKDLENEAVKLGLISGTDAKNADAMMHSWADLGTVLQNTAVLIIGPLFPVITEQTKKLSSYLSENRDKLRTWSEAFAKKLPERIQRVTECLKALRDVLDKLTPVFDFATRHPLVGLSALAAYIAGPVLLSIAILGKSLVNLGVIVATTPIGAGLVSLGKLVAGFGLTLLTSPITWFIAGILGIVYAVKQLYDNWQLVDGWLQEHWRPWVDFLDTILSKIDSIVGKLPFFRGTAWGDVLAPASGLATIPSAQSLVRDSNVTVTFRNAPRNMSVDLPRTGKGLSVEVGNEFPWDVR